MSDKTPKDEWTSSGADQTEPDLPDMGESELDELFAEFGVNVGSASGHESAPKKPAPQEPAPKKPAPQAPAPKPRQDAPAPEAAAGEEDEAEPADEVTFFPRETPEKRRFLDALREREDGVRQKRSGRKAPPPSRPERTAPLQKDEMLVYDSELDEVDYYDPEDLPEGRDYMPIRFRRYGRLGVARGLMYALFVISVSVILACLGWMFASDVLALNKGDTTAVVSIDAYTPGAGDPTVDDEGRTIKVDVDQVATALKSAGIIQYKWLFKLYSQFSSAEVKIDPGTYDVSAKLDYRALVTALQSGSDSMETTRITFPEGYTMDQIFKLLSDNNVCDADSLYAAAANTQFDYSFLTDLPYGEATRLEGYLFPDTYEFYAGEDPDVAINRFLTNYNNKITEDMKNQAGNLGRSMRDVLITASLVEKESGASDEERANIASVIYNRLDAGMALQLDSTINYIKNSATFQLTDADLNTDSPYNTYLYEGLPAGPICNPGLASITAALNPSSTDYYYFAIDATTGETHFFTNASEFNDFVSTQDYSTLN